MVGCTLRHVSCVHPRCCSSIYAITLLGHRPPNYSTRHSSPKPVSPDLMCLIAAPCPSPLFLLPGGFQVCRVIPWPTRPIHLHIIPRRISCFPGNMACTFLHLFLYCCHCSLTVPRQGASTQMHNTRKPLVDRRKN